MREIEMRPVDAHRMSESMVYEGDATVVLAQLPASSVQCVVTSPPYWSLRDYHVPGQIGLEPTLRGYVDNLVRVFREVRRVLRDDGVMWLNIGDSYTSGGRAWRAPDKKNPARAMSVRPDTPDGLKPKDLIGVPWRLAFALQEDGWYLRSDTIWEKPNAQPESVKDRPTKCHEYIFLMSKSERYYYDWKAVLESNGRNRRSVWHVNTQPFPDAHFATFPEKLIEPCILAGSRENDFVLDPFFGSGTVGVVCDQLRRRYIGIELNPEYILIAQKRLGGLHCPLFVRVFDIAGGA